MTEFKLDTSGFVDMAQFGEFTHWTGKPWPETTIRFGELSPFVQGSIEAMFADHWHSIEFKDDDGDWVLSEGNPYADSRPFAFRDLSPETLAMFMEDGRRAREHYLFPNTAEAGKEFYQERQANLFSAPFAHPLTLYLNDAGKIAHREADQ